MEVDIDAIQRAKTKLSHGRSAIDEMERLIRVAIDEAKTSNDNRKFKKCIQNLEAICPKLRKSSSTLVDMGQTMEELISVLRGLEG